MPEPHILLTVVQGTDCGSPAPSAAWRAGAWPCPAGSTQPISTSLTSSAFKPARSTAALMAALPSCGAVSGAKAPWNPPMAVRAMPTMTMGSCAACAMGCASRGVAAGEPPPAWRWSTPGRIGSMSQAKRRASRADARQRGRRNAGDRTGPDFGRRSRADCVRTDRLTRLDVALIGVITPEPSSLDGKSECVPIGASTCVGAGICQCCVTTE